MIFKQNKWLILALTALLSACAHTYAPQSSVEQLRLIRYRDAEGNGLIPVARSAGEARTKGWQKWLTEQHNAWQTVPNQHVIGQTQWCAQWQNGEQQERICRRDNTLVWFERGILRDEHAIRSAEKIWIGR